MRPARRDLAPRPRIRRACRAASPTARAPGRVELGRSVQGRAPAKPTQIQRRQSVLLSQSLGFVEPAELLRRTVTQPLKKLLTGGLLAHRIRLSAVDRSVTIVDGEGFRNRACDAISAETP